MTLIAAVDDKIEALVGLVLQAVDQRLTAVREQLIEVANTVARQHADLQQQLDECRALITGSPQEPLAASDFSSDADATASVALLHAANLLTERVGSMESRLQQYTDDQVKRLESIITTTPTTAAVPSAVAEPVPVATSVPAPVAVAAPVAVTPVAGLVSMSAPAAVVPAASPVPMFVPAAFAARVEEPSASVVGLSPAIAQLGNLSSAARPARSNPVAMAPLVAAAAAAPVVTAPVVTAPVVTAPVVTAPVVATAAVETFDIDAFSAQLNARLGALVEKAIGV